MKPETTLNFKRKKANDIKIRTSVLIPRGIKKIVDNEDINLSKLVTYLLTEYFKNSA